MPVPPGQPQAEWAALRAAAASITGITIIARVESRPAPESAAGCRGARRASLVNPGNHDGPGPARQPAAWAAAAASESDRDSDLGTQ